MLLLFKSHRIPYITKGVNVKKVKLTLTVPGFCEHLHLTQVIIWVLMKNVCNLAVGAINGTIQDERYISC